MALPNIMADVLQNLGHFGWIPPEKRNAAQHAAHERAMAAMPRLNKVNPDLVRTLDIPKGTKVMLTDFWKSPQVIAEIGRPFTGFGQYTGSCVGVSEGNGVTTVLCVQSSITTDNPTKAEVCFWPFPYGRTRYNEGDRGEGEGAVDSVMGETLAKEGWYPITEPGLPAFRWDADGLWLVGGERMEYQWSDGAAIDRQWRELAVKRAGMTKVIVNAAEEIAAGIVNGYPTLTGCSMYVGHGQITGSGELAYVRGHYDGRGGHSTCRLGVWNHPNDGLLIGYSNQWQTSTYPADPAGLGRCCVWVPISEEEKMLRSLGGSEGETMLLSHVPGVPAQPQVLTSFGQV